MTQVGLFNCLMPIELDDGWNHLNFHLSDLTKETYGTNYVKTPRVQIHANVRIRRVYFADRKYSEDETPGEFKPVLKNQKSKVPEV